LLTLYILYRMLLARTAGGRGTARITATVVPSHPRTPFNTAAEIRWTTPRNTYRLHASLSSPKMLRGAVEAHEQKAPSKPTSFFGSSPPAASQNKGSQGVSAGYRNPLGPAGASAMNGVRSSQQRTTNSVKRNASGLAKALDGTFEEGPGSKLNPISVGGARNNNMGMLQVTQNEFVDENAFDSDIELDFKEPVAKKGPSYPSLPQQRTSTSSAAPLVYPTLPRQQQAQTSFSRDVNPPYNAPPSAAGDAPVASSAPIPWSSSPAEHYDAAFSPSKSAKSKIQGYTFNKPMGATQHFQNGPPPPEPQPKAKRRALPWHDEEPNQPTYDRFKPKYKSNTISTPASKATRKPSMPWNTTASAVKEQQKQHREEIKRAVKKNDGDEEAMLKAKTSRERPARVFLSEEQQHVLDLVIEKKKSVFFTGSAGTGKSVLMREIISSFRKVYKREPDRVAVTASTGLAACNVGGVTLHSFAGIGLGKEDATELVRKIKRNQKAKHRWMRTKVLIVDEVSMVDGDLFDKLESIARQLRMNGRPFGGIQVVITGDFFQLPPVPDYGKVAKFAFDAATWNTTIDHTIGLHHVFRQKDPSMCLYSLFTINTLTCLQSSLVCLTKCVKDAYSKAQSMLSASSTGHSILKTNSKRLNYFLRATKWTTRTSLA